MKKITIILLVAFLSVSAYSQEFQVNPFASFHMGGKLNGYDKDLKFENGVNFGLGLSRGFQGKNIEVSYTHFLTDAVLQFKNGDEDSRSSAHMGYIQIGLVQDFQTGNGKVLPFFLISTGATYLKISSIGGSSWSFSMATGGGLKYFFNDAVGLRIQARFLLPMYFNGYCGYGYCNGSYRAIPQGDFTGGLVFRILN